MLVIGLGNPGGNYALSRHNVGFMVIDLIVLSATRVVKTVKKPWGLIRFLRWNHLDVITLQPFTYMNNSGVALSRCFEENYVPHKSMFIVVHDDLDLPVGRIKITRGGGTGGHKGVESIVDALGHKNFPRIKIGIGRPLYGETITDYVLSPPYPEQEKILHQVLRQTLEALKIIMLEGLDKAMNRFNSFFAVEVEDFSIN